MEPTDTQLDNALEYSRVLSEVEREIIAAFTGHFAGKPGMYVPATQYNSIRSSGVSEFGQRVTDAIESVHDYAEVLMMFHAVIRGQKPIADYQHAVMKRYLDMNAADIAELRSGLESPVSYVAPSIHKFIADGATA
jgi:hypothetical protein